MTIKKGIISQLLALLGLIATIAAANAAEEADFLGVWECAAKTYVDQWDSINGGELTGWQTTRQVVRIWKEDGVLKQAWCNLTDFDNAGYCKVENDSMVRDLLKVTSAKTGFEGYCLREREESLKGQCWYAYRLSTMGSEESLFKVANPLGQKLVFPGTYAGNHKFKTLHEAGSCIRMQTEVGEATPSIVGEVQ